MKTPSEAIDKKYIYIYKRNTNFKLYLNIIIISSICQSCLLVSLTEGISNFIEGISNLIDATIE